MEIEGSIEEFSVPEILQFFSLHKADGVLRMKSGKEEVDFGFKKGKIAAAAHKGEEFFYSINDYLFRAGKITEKELKDYNKRANELNVSVFQLLLQEGIVGGKELREIISFKIQEIIDEVLTWKEGRYSFHPGEALYTSSSITVELDPNSLVMEGMWRIDEWPQIRTVLPDDNVVLKKKDKPDIALELGDKEKKVLEKITDGITIGELIRITGLGKFQTYNAAYRLIEMGVLRKGGEELLIKKVSLNIPFKAIIKEAFLIGFIIINLFFFIRFKLDRLGNFFQDVKKIVQTLDK
jgi:hypothetical protein